MKPTRLLRYVYPTLFLLLSFSLSVFSQQKTITGKVVDQESNTPLAGVSITLKGSTTTVVSNDQGEFSIRVPSGNAVLTVTSVGYTSQDLRVGEQSAINVSLVSSNKQLSEVIVVGYGTQKKRNVTGAVATYGADDITERPVARIDQALVGQMAGVQVKQTSGTPGKAFSIQVRGSGSITAGNEPLYVLDGFPLSSASPNGSGNFATGNPLDNLNPNDIESIQVLKDAAAAAIYGSRAANGVVLITTKRGQSGKPKINFNTYMGYSERNRKLDMLNADEFVDRAIEMINAQWVGSGAGRSASQTTEQRRTILGLQPGQVNTNFMIDDRWLQPGHPGLQYIDWQDEAFRKGLTQNHQLSASGANEFVRYYVSGNFMKQEGMVIGMDYTAFSGRANVEITPNKKLKFGINIAPTYSVSNDPGVEGKDNLLHWIVSMSPVQEELPENVNVGNYGAYRWTSATTQFNSPIARLKHTIGQNKRFRTLATIFGEYQILSGLSFRTTVNLDNTDNNGKRYLSYLYAGVLPNRPAQPGVGTTGGYTSYRKQTFVNENTLSYNKIINDVHDLSLLAGASYNSDKIDNATLSSLNGFGSSVITTLNAASAITGNTTETKNVLLSYFGRLQYSFNNKYLFSASIRRDGSSRFGTNTKWGVFPSASLGWRVSEEKFLQNVELISDLKLRVSWGKSGNYNIGDYSSIPLLSNYNYTLGNNLVFGQAPRGIINPDLSWEKSQTWDYGLDIGVLKNRITASFDIYNKLNTDLLLNVPIPGNTGFPTFLNNAGSVRNRGWEVELSSRNTTGKFQWRTSLNLSHNSNKVVALSGGQSQILIPSSFDIPHSILKVGEPLYSINVVKQTGILTAADISGKAALLGSQTVGDAKYFDANNDGVINANDRVIVGHPNPDYTWGITNTFSYKGFNLNILLQGQWGGSIYSLWGRAINRTGMVYADNTLGIYKDRWRSPQDPGAGQVGKAYSTFGRIKNTDWLYSSDYVRVRNMTLGYDLGLLFKNKAVQGARIYATAENFFGRDKYSGGMNPEASNTDLSGSSLFPESGDYGGLPLPKSLIVGVNITF